MSTITIGVDLAKSISLEYGLQPRLMAAQFVTPFRKSRTAKNDRNDAEAIATAARQGNMRFVPVKDVEQQARLAWHRARAAACSGPRRSAWKRPRPSNAGYANWTNDCPSARCWWQSPTSTHGNCGRCWRTILTTIHMLA